LVAPVSFKANTFAEVLLPNALRLLMSARLRPRLLRPLLRNLSLRIMTQRPTPH
jgi:hypothetical protein